MIRVRKAVHPADLMECNSMQTVVFTGGEHRNVQEDHWWIAEVDGKSAGFACLKVFPDDNSAYLALAGVMPQYRGRGIQKLLIRVRERFARKLGAKVAVTYTAYLNWASANSLIRMGYTLYSPQTAWGLKWSLYFRKDLQ
jgi:GNAT superfamily N-acetyltransferase